MLTFYYIVKIEFSLKFLKVKFKYSILISYISYYPPVPICNPLSLLQFYFFTSLNELSQESMYKIGSVELLDIAITLKCNKCEKFITKFFLNIQWSLYSNPSKRFFKKLAWSPHPKYEFSELHDDKLFNQPLTVPFPGLLKFDLIGL